MFSLYIWGYCRFTYIHRSNVTVPAGSEHYTLTPFRRPLGLLGHTRRHVFRSHLLWAWFKILLCHLSDNSLTLEILGGRPAAQYVRSPTHRDVGPMDHEPTINSAQHTYGLLSGAQQGILSTLRLRPTPHPLQHHLPLVVRNNYHSPMSRWSKRFELH